VVKISRIFCLFQWQKGDTPGYQHYKPAFNRRKKTSKLVRWTQP